MTASGAADSGLRPDLRSADTPAMSSTSDAGGSPLLVWSARRVFVEDLADGFADRALQVVTQLDALQAALDAGSLTAAVVDAVEGADAALDACARIAAANVPVLVVAAREDTMTMRHALRAGAKEFAEAPVSGAVLALRVERMERVVAEHRELAREAREARQSAEHDGLTGLAGRTSFLRTVGAAIERARAGDYPAAVLYLDLDRFKSINDTLGHDAGDTLLREVARILRSHVRPTDVVGAAGVPESGLTARLGGDEFSILLSKIRHPDDAGRVARRVLEALGQPISIDGHEVTPSGSVGIAAFPRDGEDGETLLKRADMAMYEAKAEPGGGAHRFYRPSMGKALLRRLELEEGLRRALDRDEFEVRYQPRVDVGDDRIVGMEALLRWNSAELGPVSPGEFIPVAEETGLITPIGAWVLDTAAAQLADWHAAGLRDLRISVNVSPRQFASGDVNRTVMGALQANGLHPSDLELEITESLILGDDDGTAEALRELRTIGVVLALDDFGTGYSSLGLLTRFPLDVLKIDRSIAASVVDDPAAASVVEAVVTMGGRLGLRIVAEGVDEQEQAELLRELGCDEIQGFLISPAVDPEAFSALIGSWPGLFGAKSRL